MSYQVHVYVRGPASGLSEWRAIHPTGGRPYSFATCEEAEAARRMCYPLESNLLSDGRPATRIVEE